MKVQFHPGAQQEFYDAISYYESCREGLGLEFAEEAYSALERITANPLIWPIVEYDIRRCLVRRFPFGVLYHAQESEVLIIAVMHLHRHPDYWKCRTNEQQRKKG